MPDPAPRLFISVTRLRLRSIRFLPAFAFHTQRSITQVRVSPGFRGGSLLPDRRWTFWTMTAWDGQAEMRAYMTAGSHRTAMPRLIGWCDEASIVHWEQDGDLPSWAEAAERMRAQGRPSKLRHPSPDHAGLRFAAPKHGNGGAIRPRPGKDSSPRT